MIKYYLNLAQFIQVKIQTIHKKVTSWMNTHEMGKNIIDLYINNEELQQVDIPHKL